MTGRHSIELPVAGPGDHFPSPAFHGVGGRAASLTHKKKKKKKSGTKWIPLLALGALEDAAYPIVKGRKRILRSLKKSRQQREWIIGNYYWALWKWRMKEIHDADFKFVPTNCAASLHDVLSTPVPAHMLKRGTVDEGSEKPPSVTPGPATAPLVGDLGNLPPPVSHLLGRGTGVRLSKRGESILRAIQAPVANERSRCLPRREAILRALTDDTYA